MSDEQPAKLHVRATASDRRLLVLHDEHVAASDLLERVFDGVSPEDPFPRARLQTRYFNTVIDCWIESFVTGSELQLADAYTSPEAAEVLAALGAVLVYASSDSVIPLLARLEDSLPEDVAAIACWPDAEEAVLHGFEVVSAADTRAIRMAIEVGMWTEQRFDDAPVELDHAASMLRALRGESSVGTHSSSTDISSNTDDHTLSDADRRSRATDLIRDICDMPGFDPDLDSRDEVND